ncbi:nicotinate-nucleotide adenylyltransferase [Viridibacillus sp. YIM B01967]|uniref:Probable nicotinate-nucleotide adenylyltransferase n=1 Tax=Viridibacillus soli TaxID=2798301 RepID=A0ABS1H1U8_9BACL|nr:nicotinate-nucleotide adenylyltransferase [Viridibacillus soli]MBK3493354.1 nicotinate-nucleotide adenylyltransferase [Viridibacillus soli]
MRKIGLLGGTFNPPHNGHLMMANEVYDALGLDEVRFMPNAIPPHKLTPDDATTADRKKMTELSINPYTHFKLEPYEIESGGISYTYETMKNLTTREPDCEFYFIIGGDMIDMLDSWYKIDELMELVKFVGVNRPHTKAETTLPVQMIAAPLIDLSSTLIRERMQADRTVTFLVPTEVEQYIREEGLYGTQ